MRGVTVLNTGIRKILSLVFVVPALRPINATIRGFIGLCCFRTFCCSGSVSLARMTPLFVFCLEVSVFDDNAAISIRNGMASLLAAPNKSLEVFCS